MRPWRTVRSMIATAMFGSPYTLLSRCDVRSKDHVLSSARVGDGPEQQAVAFLVDGHLAEPSHFVKCMLALHYSSPFRKLLETATRNNKAVYTDQFFHPTEA